MAANSCEYFPLNSIFHDCIIIGEIVSSSNGCFSTTWRSSIWRSFLTKGIVMLMKENYDKVLLHSKNKGRIFSLWFK